MNPLSSVSLSQRGIKPLSYSAFGRIALALPVLALLWLAIYWAVLLP